MSVTFVGWNDILGICKIFVRRNPPFSVLFHSRVHSNLWQNQKTTQKDLLAFVLPDPLHRCMASADELFLTGDRMETLTWRARRLLKHLFLSSIAASCKYYFQPSHSSTSFFSQTISVNQGFVWLLWTAMGLFLGGVSTLTDYILCQ